MENAEGILQTLEEYMKLKPNDIPSELNDYLGHVAKTGDPVFQWSLVKFLFRDKLAKTITDFYESCPAIDLPPCPNVDAFNYEVLKNSLLERLDSFSSAPFTVQRICELLINPRKEYSRVDKYMRAIEKNILVVSTKEPGIPKRPEGIQPEPVMNGVIDSRGIELGEAIETVSSDGVNLMHAENSDVSVTESVRLLDCTTNEEIEIEERSRPIANIKAWQKNQQTILLVTDDDSKNYETKELQVSPGVDDKIIENIELNSTDGIKNGTLLEPDATESVVESFNQGIVSEVTEEVSDQKNVSTLLQVEADKSVFDINLSEITPDKSPGDEDENNISTELEATTENIVSEAIAIVEENIQKECEADENIGLSKSVGEVCVKPSDQLLSVSEPLLESVPDTVDKSAYDTSSTLGTVITVLEDLTESVAKDKVKETCVNVSDIVSLQGELPDDSESAVESQSVDKESDIQTFVVAEESDASVCVEPVKVVEDSVPSSSEQSLPSEQSTLLVTQEDGEGGEALPGSVLVGARLEEDACPESSDMEPVEIESTVEQDEAMDVDETSLPMEVATEEEPMDQSEEIPGAGGAS